MATQTGQRTVSSVNSGILPLNFSSKVFNPEVDKGRGPDFETVLFRLLYKLGEGLGKETKTRKFQVADDEFEQRQTSILAIATPTATVFTVPTDIGLILRPGFLLKNLKTAEVYYILGVIGDTITVTRDWGTFLGGAAATTANGDNLAILGEAAAEGGASGEAISNQVDISYNFTSFIRTPFDVSDHDYHGETEIGNDWDRISKRAMIQHRIQIEYQLWHSYRNATTHPTTGKPLHTTGGVLQHIQGNIHDLSANTGGVLTEREMDAAMEMFFQNGSNEKWGWTGTHFLSGLSSFAKNKMRFHDRKSKEYGMNITVYEHGGNKMYIVEHKKVFTGYGATSGYTGGTLASQLVVMDMNCWGLRHFKGMGTKLHKNIQQNDVSGRKDEWRTTIGVEGRPGIDNPRNVTTAPDQFLSPNGKLIGFDTY